MRHTATVRHPRFLSPCILPGMRLRPELPRLAIRSAPSRWARLAGLARRLERLVDSNKALDQMQGQGEDQRQEARTVSAIELSIRELSEDVGRECDRVTSEVLVSEVRSKMEGV